MKKVLVSGINGHMGQILCRLIAEDPDMEVVCGYDQNTTQLADTKIPIYSDATQIRETPNVIIDFSAPIATRCMADFAGWYNIPIVVATTGISEELIDYMNATICAPVFYSANMSYDVCVFQRILEVAVPLLKGADIEITEEHHRRKKDSPSGTAIMLANTINNLLDNTMEKVYGRTEKRKPNEIGISSVRGGNVCGTHTVHFFGESDILEIKHTALSRDVFAEGAIKAAKFITEEGRKPGLYTMDDLF